MSRVWRSRSALVALAVMLVAAAVLAVTRSAPTSVLPARAAIRDALRNQAVNQALAGTRWSSASASPLASQLERVTFSAGGQQVAQAAVRPDGTVDEVEALAHDRVPYGDWIAYEPAVLAALAVLFVLMAGVAPWRRLRNLDVLATLSLVLPVLLLERGYLSGSVLGALPGLAYLLLRCAWRGFARAPEPSPSTALFDLVTRRWEPGRRVRVLRLLLAALAIVFFMVGVSSPNAIDVAYAAMEGATRIIHGVLPYGHMPGDVIHGDTYPILSYALYVPVAWLAPVESVFSSVDGALAVAVLGALAVAVALYRGVAGPRPPQRRRPPSAETAGLRAGLAWLSFPPVLIIASTGTTDVVLAAMLAFAVLLWRRPAASMAVLAVAGWFKLSPFALVPLWLAPLRGPRLLAAIAAFVGVSAAALGLVVALGGAGGPASMAHAVAYQLDRSSLQSPWTALGIVRWQPLGQAGVLALIAAAAMRLMRDRELGTDRARVAALSGAILVALQLVANYWSFLYLAWTVPLVVASLLAPEVRPRSHAGSRAPVPAPVSARAPTHEVAVTASVSR